MPDDILTAASEAAPQASDELAGLQAEMERASAAGRPIDEPLRRFINRLLEDEGHPEQATTNLAPLSRQIAATIGPAVPEAQASIIEEQLVALRAGHEAPSTDPQVRRIHYAVEPVMMFNGQFVHQADDIRLRGAGIDFVFTRTYRSQVPYAGPLGANWDHSYNLRLREAGQTVFRGTGGLREDPYVRHPRNGYFVPPDGEHGVLLEQGDSFVYRSPAGDRYTYQRTAEHPFIHRIVRIEDRFGNFLDFAYQQDRLQRVVVNHPDRVLEFAYDDQERISLIRDWTRAFGPQGRQWRYAYDDLGDLVAVTVPATDRYPAGLTTRYEYSSARTTGALQHNLERLIDPAGRTYVENEYGRDAGLLSFNRVVRQRQGGGEASFDYQDVVQEFDFDYRDMERPAHQTTLIERNGHPVHYVYNRFGNLLLQEEVVLQEGLPRTLEWRYRYNADGAQVGVLSPDGMVTQQYFGRDDFLRRHQITDEQVPIQDELTVAARMAFGNLLATVRRGRRATFAGLDQSRGPWGDFFSDVLAADPEDVVTKLTYEPTYQQVLTSSDPRHTRSADPADPETPRYQQTLTRHDYRGPPGDQFRLLDRVRYPALHQPDGTVLAPVEQTYPQYDDNGRPLRSVDPEGTVTESEYFGDGEGVRAGYLKRTTVDPADLALQTSYEVNEAGLVTTIVHPRAVGGPPGSFRTVLEVDALDQVTRRVTPAPFAFETRFLFDRAGQLERVERDLVDEFGRPFAGGIEVRTHRRDEQGNLVRESIGGLDLASHLVTRHSYDASDQRIRTILPRGNRRAWSYDERLLQRSATRGAGSAQAATIRTDYDGDGLPSRAIDGRGNITRYTRDALGRLVATTDPLGNITRVDYNKAGNPTVERFFERCADRTFRLLARTDREYDELNRRIVERVNRFSDPPAATDPTVDFLAAPGPGTVVETRFFYDRKGRMVGVVDRNGHASQFAFDAADRRITEQDALGTVTRLAYDAHGNLTRRDVHEPVDEPAGGEEVFTTLHGYDELDRRTTTTDSLGNRTTFAYDSRDNQVRMVDPLGNVKRWAYDVFGRQTDAIAQTTATGLGGGPPTDPVVTSQGYDPNGNPILLVDPDGNRTQQEYDALDRLSVRRAADATIDSYRYDQDDHLVAHRDGNGLERRFTIDPLGRTTQTTLDTAGLPAGLQVEGATFELYDYDGLGRVILERNDHLATARKFNSLGHAEQETVQLHVRTPAVSITDDWTLTREFDALGNLFRLTYPAGRTIRYHRDVLDRIQRIENLTVGPGDPRSGTFGATYDIARLSYRGLRPQGGLFANGTVTRHEFDQGGRVIQLAHTARGGAELLTIQQLFDGAGNLRVRADHTPAGSRGEAFRYDSLSWLTKTDDQAAPPRFDPADFAPFTTTPEIQELNGETTIDARIGPLAQNPLDFTFRYDQAGNRLEEREPPAAPIAYAPNQLNQYAQVGTADLRYDPNGNLLDDSRLRYAYDYRNLLVRVTDAATGQDLARFFHDAQGRRIASLIEGQATRFVFNGHNVIEEGRDGTVLAQYVTGPEPDAVYQLATRTGTTGHEHWYHRDLVRSVRLLTDETGRSAATYRYTSFGELLEDTAAFNPYRFMGRRFDEPIRAYDFRVREYAPTIGRFLQRDIPAGPNPYLFVGNNPLTAVDPSGRERQSIATGAAQEPAREPGTIETPTTPHAETLAPANSPTPPPTGPGVSLTRPRTAPEGVFTGGPPSDPILGIIGFRPGGHPGTPPLPPFSPRPPAEVPGFRPGGHPGVRVPQPPGQPPVEVPGFRPGGHPGVRVPQPPGQPPVEVPGFRPGGHPGVRVPQPPGQPPVEVPGFRPQRGAPVAVGASEILVIGLAASAVTWAVIDIRRAYQGETTLSEEAWHFWTHFDLLPSSPSYTPDSPWDVGYKGAR
jgi:RHS repeat-associated protein